MFPFTSAHSQQLLLTTTLSSLPYLAAQQTPIQDIIKYLIDWTDARKRVTSTSDQPDSNGDTAETLHDKLLRSIVGDEDIDALVVKSIGACVLSLDLTTVSIDALEMLRELCVNAPTRTKIAKALKTIEE